MNSDERICSIALTLCPGIGHIGAKRLIEGMGSAAEVFSRRKELPEIMPGVNPGVVTALDCPAAFSACRAGDGVCREESSFLPDVEG